MNKTKQQTSCYRKLTDTGTNSNTRGKKLENIVSRYMYVELTFPNCQFWSFIMGFVY